jgi:hypothetical protein
MPLTSAYTARGGFPGRRRPPCVRGRWAWPTDGAKNPTDGGGGSGYTDRPPGFLHSWWCTVRWPGAEGTSEVYCTLACTYTGFAAYPTTRAAARGRAAPRAGWPRNARNPGPPVSSRHGGATGRTGPCVAIPASRSRHGVTRSACLMCDDARHGRGSAHRRNPRLHRCGIQRLVARDVARTKRDRRLEERAPKIAPRLRQMATPGRLGYLS